MSRSLIIARRALAASALLLPTLAGAQNKTPPAPMPVKAAAIPPFQEATLANGLRVLLVESARQPVVSVALMMPAGDVHDPAGKEGLTTLVADVITKGAGTRTAEQVAAAIEGVGGSMSASSGADFMNVRANVLAENAPLAFELVADAVQRPTFATKEVELARTQMLSGLQLEQSNPSALASRFFAASLYGEHPYAKRPKPASVRAITMDDMRNFQRTHLVPRGSLLVVAGNIGMARVRELAQQYFGGWAGSAPPKVARGTPPARDKTEILLVHRPGSVQSNIVVGNLTFGPADPSFYAMTVASKILGGGTDARLFTTLREKKSWTYGSYSRLDRYQDVGSMVATAEVRNAVTDSALVELLNIERDLATRPVSALELESAKNALVGRLPLEIETAQGLAEQIGRYTMLGLPKEYIRTLRPRLASVTAKELQRATSRYLRPDKSLIVVVGDGAQIYDKLAKIAPVRIVNAQGDAMQPSDLVATTTATLPVDMTRLVARADSFGVFVQGNPFGFQTTTLEKVPAGYAYRTQAQLGPMLSQRGEVVFDASLKPLSTKSSGKAGGADIATDLVYAGGRVKGTASAPAPGGAGLRTVKVDTTLAPSVVDANMVGALVPALRWGPKATFTASTFDAASGGVKQVTLTASGTESVTVPAGTFDTYRVDVAGTQPMTLWITTAVPHRVVKMAFVQAPIEFRLIK